MSEDCGLEAGLDHMDKWIGRLIGSFAVMIVSLMTAQIFGEGVVGWIFLGLWAVATVAFAVCVVGFLVACCVQSAQLWRTRHG